ncbi:MAG: hypothetical protein LBG46_00950 [Elusimicrobiota bacterium]|jgi:hypothetical protein|nr:hypothetical protein [Elusimicrobiota bacterium]
MKKFLALLFLLVLLVLLFSIFPIAARADIISPGKKRIRICTVIDNVTEYKNVQVTVFSWPYGIKDEKPVAVKPNECLPTTYMPSYLISVDGKNITVNGEKYFDGSQHMEVNESSSATEAIGHYNLIRHSGNDWEMKLINEEFPGRLPNIQERIKEEESYSGWADSRDNNIYIVYPHEKPNSYQSNNREEKIRPTKTEHSYDDIFLILPLLVLFGLAAFLLLLKNAKNKNK